MQATKSSLSILQIRSVAWKSTRPMTAEMMMEARIALGVCLKTGVMSSKVRNTFADMTMAASHVIDS